MDELEVGEQDTSELVVEFEVVNAAFEEEAADKEALAYVVGAEVGQNEAGLGGKDKAEFETEGGLAHGLVRDLSDHVAGQQVEVAAVVVELASDSEMVGQQEPEYVKAVEIVLVLEVVVGVEAEIGVGSVAGAVIELEVGADHRPAGTVEPQIVDMGSNVDTAVGMDLVQGIAGSIVDIVAAADTIALLLAAQQLGFGKQS